VETVFGLRAVDTGSIVIDHQPMSRITPALAIKLGVALVPEDRHVQGLVLDHSIERNQILPRLPRFSATQTLERYSKGVVEERRMQPGNDLGSALLRAEEAGESLTDDEMISNVLLLFVAGHETTSNMLRNALIALHRHPEQLARLKRDATQYPARRGIVKGAALAAWQFVMCVEGALFYEDQVGGCITSSSALDRNNFRTGDVFDLL
jgi:hypothetical protein